MMINLDDYKDHGSEKLDKLDLQIDPLIIANFSSRLSSYKYLMNPIRLLIVKLLYHYTQMARSEIQKMLEINSGVFENHLNKLMQQKIIESRREFVDGRARVNIYINPYGIKKFEEFKKVLESLI